MDSIVETIKEIVKKQFEDEGTGHDWFHIERVYKVSKHIQSFEGGDLELIELAALLHDISDHKFNGGSATKGGDIAFELLITHGFSNERALLVKNIINQVSFKGAKVQDETNSIEAQIVQDADRLDAIGAIGIARAFAYGGSKNRLMYHPDINPVLHDSFESYKNSKSHTINHFYEKLLLLHDKLHTNTARKIGKKRHQIMIDYLDNFYAEWNFE